MNSNGMEPETFSIDYPGNDYAFFTQSFEHLSGIRLGMYKEKQMKRRINTLIRRKKLNTYRDFISLLETNATELEAFIDYITINVTEFFRTPDQWQVFEEVVLPQLGRTESGHLKIWCCACATGQEPYSIAMSLQKCGMGDRFSILATDLDEKVLDLARSGIYDRQAMNTLPDNCRDRFFNQSSKGWEISDELKEMVQFRRFDLLRDEYPTNLDLVVCRNVLIYFTEDAKDMIYEKFRTSLKPGGYLFTGNTEQLIYYKSHGFQKLRGFLYQKL